MIPVFKPSMDREEIKAVAQVLKSGWIGLGPKTREFEEKFAQYIGVKYAVAVNSCTAALDLSLRVIDVHNKAVITTPLTFIATNIVILHNHGRPIFVDVEEDTLNISPQEIEKNITPQTKAIVVVHYGGHACQMDEVLRIAKKHRLFVIEDAAHACGGEYKGRKLGSFGDFGCFSFHAVKNLATGDGGMITTNNKVFYERLKKLRWLGISSDTWSRERKMNGKLKRYSWYYNVEEVGYKCHMDDIKAAIGIVQLTKLDKANEKRRQICQIYDMALAQCTWLDRPVEREYARSARHNYVIKTDYRDRLNAYLATKGISTGVHYVPNNHYRIFRGCKGKTPVAEKVWQRLLTLPLYPDLTKKDLNYIISSIRSFL